MSEVKKQKWLIESVDFDRDWNDIEKYFNTQGPTFDTDWLKEITKETINWAQGFGDFLARETKDSKPLTTTQLRRFFGEIKRIQISREFKKEKHSILMLKPKLAYAVARDEAKKKTKIGHFYTELAVALDAIKVKKPKKAKNQFENFVRIYEAIVAYHKAREVNS